MVIYGVGGLLSKVTFDYIKKKININNSFRNILLAIKEVYGNMSNLAAVTGAYRVVIYKGENGGGVPKLGNSLYSSAIYEIYKDSPIKVFWQRQPMDAKYTENLLQVYSNKFLLIITRNLPKCQQRTLYDAEGIRRVEMHKIRVDKTRFIYLELQFTDEDELNPKIEHVKRASINTLINLFDKNSLD